MAFDSPALVLRGGIQAGTPDRLPRSVGWNEVPLGDEHVRGCSSAGTGQGMFVSRGQPIPQVLSCRDVKMCISFSRAGRRLRLFALRPVESRRGLRCPPSPSAARTERHACSHFPRVDLDNCKTAGNGVESPFRSSSQARPCSRISPASARPLANGQG